RRLSLGLGLLLPLATGVTAQPPAVFVGIWKVITLPPGREVTLFLLGVEQQGDKLQAKVLSASLPNFRGTTVQAIEPDGMSLRVRRGTPGGVVCAVVGYAQRGDTRPARLLGSIEARGRRDFARRERTDAKELDASRAVTASPALEEYDKALEKAQA